MTTEREEQKQVTLIAYKSDGQYKVWCQYCDMWHYHGEVNGWRVAHCGDERSPYKKTGYYLKEARKKDINDLRNIIKSYK